ncbi:MAG: hypothetical protein A2W09_09245 [Deltaproteobacteria bacterium RBG_16_50_11]|nr:MAG: hypothetical protein A2W09_09245 [Deltaproteobacteria bacterium RBG_16_50_11]
MTSGIPTKYKNIRFRSRLEARWAAFFDRCKWRWSYEPLDLPGYIPDFLLHVSKGDLLIEVKPTRPLDDFESVIHKIIKSGWRGPVAILCGTWDEDSMFSVRVGFGTPYIIDEPELSDMGGAEGYWGDVALVECANCDGPALMHAVDWPTCLCCGFSGKNSPDDIPPESWVKLRVLSYNLRELWWAEAGNDVQWKPRK